MNEHDIGNALDMTDNLLHTLEENYEQDDEKEENDNEKEETLIQQMNRIIELEKNVKELDTQKEQLENEILSLKDEAERENRLSAVIQASYEKQFLVLRNQIQCMGNSIESLSNELNATKEKLNSTESMRNKEKDEFRERDLQRDSNEKEMRRIIDQLNIEKKSRGLLEESLRITKQEKDDLFNQLVEAKKDRDKYIMNLDGLAHNAAGLREIVKKLTNELKSTRENCRIQINKSHINHNDKSLKEFVIFANTIMSMSYEQLLHIDEYRVCTMCNKPFYQVIDEVNPTCDCCLFFQQVVEEKRRNAELIKIVTDEKKEYLEKLAQMKNDYAHQHFILISVFIVIIAIIIAFMKLFSCFSVF